MAQRVYGPVRGAGTQLTELEGDKPIEPGALGMVGYAGLFEKGMVDALNQCLSKTAFLKKMGTYITDGQAPDAAIDYYDGAKGAGGGWIIRVTDGNELQAGVTLYARSAALLIAMGTLKAKNGGRWGGKADKYTDEVANMTDFTETTITTAIATWQIDQWKGGYMEHPDVASTQYEIISNTAAGVITLAAGSTLKTDIGAGTDKRYYFILDNDEKELMYEIRDGITNPTTEFGLFIYVDGTLTNSWENLSVDPASARFWESIVNDDTSNDEVVAADLDVGTYPAVRPATHFGNTTSVTTTVLTADIHDFTINSPGGGDPTFALGTTDDVMVAQKITLTMSSPTAFDAVSGKFGSLGAGTLGVLFTPNNKWSPPFTATAGANPLSATDTLVINYKPFLTDSLIGGDLYPDKPNERREKYRIVDNNHKTITVADGSDLTTSGAPNDDFMVVAALAMVGGRDGNSAIADADYNNQAWDTSTSPFNQLRGKNVGLVKMATPGVTATAVQKAGIAYANAKNHQYRVEATSATLTEEAADAYYNDTIGRDNYAVTTFPSYAYVADPEGGGGYDEGIGDMGGGTPVGGGRTDAGSRIVEASAAPQTIHYHIVTHVYGHMVDVGDFVEEHIIPALERQKTLGNI